MNMIGQLLDGRYRIIQVLSSGAFGQTYLAADTRRPGHPQCVVKQLRPPSNRSTVLKTAHRLFKQEAEILEKLGKHDQVPFLLAYFEESNQFYLVEEFVPGTPLIKEIVPGKPWAEDRVIALLEEILEVLLFVHGQGVIHRDVNPSNLIRRKTDNKLVLIDFGSVKEVSNQIANSQNQMPRTIATGTPSYMPIEQFQGNPQFNSDIYAVGMIGIQALTGLPASDLPKLQDPNPSHSGEIVWRHLVKVNPGLADIIDKMVHHHFGRRYHNTAEVLEALRKIRGHNREGTSVPSRIHVKPWKGFATIKRKWTPQIGLALGVVGTILLAAFLLSFFNRPTPVKAKDYYDRGVEKARGGNPDGAIADFNKVIEFTPNDPQVFYRRGNAYYDRGIQESEQGSAEAAQKDYQAAIADYSHAITLDANNTNAYYNRALTRYEIKDFRGAVDDYTEVIRIQPQDSEAYYQRGLVYYDLENYEAAIADYAEVIRLQPKQAKAYHARGLARGAAGDLQGAIGDYTETIRLEPKEIKGYYSRGRARFHLGDYRGALADYNQVIQIDPKNVEAFTNRCSTQINLRDYQAAIQDCTAAIDLNQQDAVAYNNRCIAYLNLQDYPKAVADCSEAIKIEPNNTNAYSNRGLASFEAGDNQGAIADYTKAIGLDPNSAEAYGNRAQVYFDVKDYNASIADYAQAIRLNPNYAAAYYGRANVRAALGDKKGSIEDLEKAGKLYLEQGRTDGYKNTQYEIEKLKSSK